ncbi:MAG: outer membrane lipoprotein carrier protein LolA [Deltaproteobacteria bacterium]|nr:outer membrane lipoprotein carrier protein LolA [Deltaproteobacteria bacterium]
MKWKHSLFLSIFILLSAQPLLADKLLDVQRSYEQHPRFTVEFYQDTYQSIVNKQIHFTGKVSYKRGVGVRMDVYTPQKQIIILKGDTVWIYLPDEGTSSVQEIPKEIATQNILAFFSGIGNLSENYSIQDNNDFFTMTPKNGTGSIRVWLDDENFLKRIQVNDATGNQSDVHLLQYTFNASMENDLFDPEQVMQSIDK